MSPALLLALSLISVDAPATAGSSDAQFQAGAGFASAPADDYGYVGWCYGAVAGYIDQYEKAMPEVERIERAFPTPNTEENIKVIYPGQRANAREQLNLFRSALTAAEKASPKPIQAEGAAAIAKGRAVWGASTLVTPAKLAQFWMSWTPPSECETRAKALAAKASLFGQALKFNAEEAPAPEAETVAEAPAEAAPAETPAPEVAPASTELSMSAEPQLIRASGGAEALLPADEGYLTAGDLETLARTDDNGVVDVDVGP